MDFGQTHFLGLFVQQILTKNCTEAGNDKLVGQISTMDSRYGKNKLLIDLTNI